MFGLLKKLRASKLIRALRAYQDARARYQDAILRGDTRDQKHAYDALLTANTARLRLELRG